MTYTPKLGGWILDERDTSSDRGQDYSFTENLEKIERCGSALQETLTKMSNVLDLRPWCSPIEDQGQVGSCVGNGTVGALEFLQIRNGRKFEDLSRLFVYYNARLMVQAQENDVGAYIHIAFGTLSSLGTCSENKWPYNVEKVFVRPTWGSYREAYANKINSYYRISSSGDERNKFIKMALDAQHPVVFGMIVDDEYQNYRGGIVKMPRSTRLNPGGHCQVIVGYDDNRKLWIVRNSWGKWWGESGYAWVPYDYLDASDASDFWVPYLEPDNVA